MHLPVARPLACFLLLTGAAHFAHAARPFVTDDARIVDPGGCQIESFTKRQTKFGENEFWFLPACTAGERVELTFGGLRLENAAGGMSDTWIAQAKTLLRPLTTNDYGLALTLGTSRLHPSPGAPPAGWSPYFNLISSVSLRDDSVVIHGNVGAVRDRQAMTTRATWGLGAEIPVTARFIGIVEGYGLEGERPSKQIGIRYWAIPDRLQFDTTYGAQDAAPQNRRWFSFGLRALF